jgi:hypothetical protein
MYDSCSRFIVSTSAGFAIKSDRVRLYLQHFMFAVTAQSTMLQHFKGKRGLKEGSIQQRLSPSQIPAYALRSNTFLKTDLFPLDSKEKHPSNGSSSPCDSTLGSTPDSLLSGSLSPSSLSTAGSFSTISNQDLELDGLPPEADLSGARAQTASPIIDADPTYSFRDYGSTALSAPRQREYEAQSSLLSSSSFPSLPILHRQISSTGLLGYNPIFPENVNSWHRAHMVALPGTEMPWETYLSPSWPTSMSADQASEAVVPGEVSITNSAAQASFNPQGTTWYTACYTCNDPNTVYQNEGSWLAHVWTAHPGWAGWVARRCTWEDCTLDKQFQTSKLWLNHVKTVHQKSFWCCVSGCELRRGGPGENPFGSKSDLKRHDRSIHCMPDRCTRPNCQGRKNSDLSRPDKRVIHEAKWHGPLSCIFPACPRRQIDGINHGFSTQAALDKHLRKKHYRHTSI